MAEAFYCKNKYIINPRMETMGKKLQINDH